MLSQCDGLTRLNEMVSACVIITVDIEMRTPAFNINALIIFDPFLRQTLHFDLPFLEGTWGRGNMTLLLETKDHFNRLVLIQDVTLDLP